MVVLLYLCCSGSVLTRWHQSDCPCIKSLALCFRYNGLGRYSSSGGYRHRRAVDGDAGDSSAALQFQELKGADSGATRPKLLGKLYRVAHVEEVLLNLYRAL